MELKQLIEKLLSETGRDKGVKGWFTYLDEHVPTLSIREAKGELPLGRFLHFSGRSGDKRGEEDAGPMIQVFPTSPYCPFSHLMQ